MVPNVQNNEKQAWMTICRGSVQFARKKVAVDKGDDADILSFVPYAQAPQTCAAGNRMPSQDNLDTPVIHQRARRWERLPHTSGKVQKDLFSLSRHHLHRPLPGPPMKQDSLSSPSQWRWRNQARQGFVQPLRTHSAIFESVGFWLYVSASGFSEAWRSSSPNFVSSPSSRFSTLPVLA